jgi:hypothetical protein
MTVYIYALIDPDSEDIRYIGKAANIDKRLSEHCADRSGFQTEKDLWIAELRAQGKKPSVKVVETCDKETWRDRERVWIAHYREQGLDLLNVGNGCEGGDVHTVRRPTAYPVRFVFRYDEEMDQRMNALIEQDPRETKIGIIRKALGRYIASSKKRKKPAQGE